VEQHNARSCIVHLPVAKACSQFVCYKLTSGQRSCWQCFVEQSRGRILGDTLWQTLCRDLGGRGTSKGSHVYIYLVLSA
jgi:hypothetical protein